jgi:cyclohexanecarboxylate-CoA ligase
VTLRPTFVPTRARHYRRPDGPWDGPSLDVVLAQGPGGAGADRLVDGDVRLDGGAVEDRVAALAGGLRARGVRAGDVVAWQLPNGHEAVLLYRACWRLGAVAAPVHHGAGAADVVAALEQVEPRLSLAAADLPLAELRPSVTVRGPGDGFAALLDSNAPVPLATSAGRPHHLAAVLFTSGSTGTPKGVLHTQRALAYKAGVMARAHGLSATDAVLMPAPLAHVSGLLNGILVPGAAGMKSVLMARWDPDRALDLVAGEAVSFMIGPPTFFVGLTGAATFSADRVASLRLVSSGGAGVSAAFVEHARQTLGSQVKRTYGSTEAPTVTTSTAADPPDRARDTDGHVVSEAELRVSDPATGRALSPGEVGELWLRGPELFVGYVDADLTRASLARGGWFRTGDLASLDGDGWLTVAGRIKDVIIRAGENIAAAEVEAVLEAHPAVRQAVAVGEPDERLGERVAAFVVTTGPFDLETCRAWFAERGVTRFKTPERVVRVDELPLLATGKPDRAALRRRLVELPP